MKEEGWRYQVTEWKHNTKSIVIVWALKNEIKFGCITWSIIMVTPHNSYLIGNAHTLWGSESMILFIGNNRQQKFKIIHIHCVVKYYCRHDFPFEMNRLKERENKLWKILLRNNSHLVAMLNCILKMFYNVALSSMSITLNIHTELTLYMSE